MKPSLFSRLFLFFLLANSFGVTGQGGTLHLIASIDNVNSDIRQGCQQDYQSAVNHFSAVAQDAGMGFNQQLLSFDLGAVTEYIQGFECGPNDVVVFFYYGHGVRYEDDGQEWPWPYLYYCEKNPDNDPESCELDMDWVQEQLIAKNARMTIVLGDSCNDVQDSPEANNYLAGESAAREDPDPSEENSYSNLDLIRAFRGHIIASAASPGQTSETNNAEGSYFAVEFFHFLLEALTTSNPTSWENILRKTKAKVQQVSGGSQTPQYCVNGRCG
ncbi:MAG: caspase family protein [Saprospirales bacterium]|nr:caspase family protein [Saprospirales bacterium]